MTTPQPGPTSRPTAQGNTLSIIGIVCGVVAVLILPIVFGPIGLVLGFVARSRGESLATVAIAVAAVGMVLGFVLGALLFSASS